MSTSKIRPVILRSFRRRRNFTEAVWSFNVVLFPSCFCIFFKGRLIDATFSDQSDTTEYQIYQYLTLFDFVGCLEFSIT